MMKFLALLALFTSTAFAAENFGTKLELLAKPDGSPHFSVQFSAAPDVSLGISFSVRGSQLVGAKPGTINPSLWAVLDKKTGKTISDWQDTGFGGSNIDPGSTHPFMLDGNSRAGAIAKSLRTSVLVLSFSANLQAPAASVYIDLGELCQKYPDKFLNADTFSKGCP